MCRNHAKVITHIVNHIRQYILASSNKRAKSTDELFKKTEISALVFISQSGFSGFFMKILKISCGSMVFGDSVSSMRV
jgi:hypothetical protein